jgi:molecular chaperone GrpE
MAKNLNFLRKKVMKKNEEENPIIDGQGEENREAETMNQNEAALPDAEQAEADPTAKLEAQLSEAKDKYLRLYSDFENYKKRINRDRIELIKTAGSDILISILPVIDDMERALKAMNETEKEGVQLVYQKMKSITEAKGLKAMESVGKPFDPELHDAITNMPAPSEDMKGKVIEEIEKGYYLFDKVIRHAKVIVGN